MSGSKKDYQRRWYAEHRSAGLCASCSRPAEEGRSQCAHHREKGRAYDRQHAARRRQTGICLAKGCQQHVGSPNRTYCQVHAEVARRRNRKRLQRAKREVLMHYGNCRCACCGETQMEFLSIDHMNGGGRRHRSDFGIGNMYVWLRKHNFPDGYQVLCMNCNFAKGRFGRCPHEDSRIDNRKCG